MFSNICFAFLFISMKEQERAKELKKSAKLQKMQVFI